MRGNQSLPNGFSLKELLVVMAIMMILVGLSLPALGPRMQSWRLSSAGQELLDQMSFARQTALSRNLQVEVRFYKLPPHGDSSGATPTVFRAFQILTVTGPDRVPYGEPRFFPAPVVCSSQLGKSPLLEDPLTTEETGVTPLPVYGTNYSYRSIYFKPSGGPGRKELDQFVTLIAANDLSGGANFFTILIDPATGNLRAFRP